MKTITILATALCLGVAMLFIGCGGAATNNATANTAVVKNTATTTTNTTTSNSATTTAANSTGSDASKATDSAAAGTGVPECDEYIKKYEACLSKIAKSAPQVEGAMKQAFEAQRSGFKSAAATATGKATLPGTCKQAMETAKTATKSYSCDW